MKAREALERHLPEWDCPAPELLDAFAAEVRATALTEAADWVDAQQPPSVDPTDYHSAWHHVADSLRRLATQPATTEES